MARTDPRVDAYIADAAEFARPVLNHVRALVHRACPEVEETIKWRFPHFVLPGPGKGSGTLCGMAAFTAHCAVTFWNPESVVGEAAVGGAMGEFGPITSVEDLPSDELLEGYVRRAAELRRAGVKRRMGGQAGPEPQVPEELRQVLDGNPKARKTFDDFSPSHRREYIEWVAEAKRPSTRRRRAAQAGEWIAQGKGRNWKYR